MYDAKINTVASQDIQEQSQQFTHTAIKKQEKMMFLYCICIGKDNFAVVLTTTDLFSPVQKSWICCMLLKGRPFALGVIFLNNLSLLIPLNSGVKNSGNPDTPWHWLAAQPFAGFAEWFFHAWNYTSIELSDYRFMEAFYLSWGLQDFALLALLAIILFSSSNRLTICGCESFWWVIFFGFIENVWLIVLQVISQLYNYIYIITIK